MPVIELNPRNRGRSTLYTCNFGSFVEVMGVSGSQELIGEICIWTKDETLIPLSDPREQVHLSGYDDTTKYHSVF